MEEFSLTRTTGRNNLEEWLKAADSCWRALCAIPQHVATPLASQRKARTRTCTSLGNLSTGPLHAAAVSPFLRPAPAGLAALASGIGPADPRPPVGQSDRRGRAAGLRSLTPFVAAVAECGRALLPRAAA
eukprot:366410-Chlamydomonas_euryale.AAC.8